MKTILSILTLLCGVLSYTSAQDDTLQFKHQFSVAYFGETFTHPGFSFSYEKSLKGWEKRKQKKSGKTKIRFYNLSWANRIAFYHHKRNHNGNMLDTGLNFSITKPKGGYLQIGLFSGGLYKHFNEDVYEVNQNNEVQKVDGAGNFTFLYGFKTTIGRLLRFKKKRIPISIFLSSNLFFSTPFGTNNIFHNALETGIKYHL